MADEYLDLGCAACGGDLSADAVCLDCGYDETADEGDYDVLYGDDLPDGGIVLGWPALAELNALGKEALG